MSANGMVRLSISVESASGLKQFAQQIAIAEATMPVLGEGRLVWHLAIEAEPAEPAVSKVQVHLFAQTPLGTNAVAVADQHILTSNSGSIEGRPVQL